MDREDSFEAIVAKAVYPRDRKTRSSGRGYKRRAQCFRNVWWQPSKTDFRLQLVRMVSATPIQSGRSWQTVGCGRPQVYQSNLLAVWMQASREPQDPGRFCLPVLWVSGQCRAQRSTYWLGMSR